MDIDLSEYDHPDLYDAENEAGEDLEFFLDLARETWGPILDIACGNGRIGLPLAAAGFEVVGIDLADTMLAHGREKGLGYPMIFQKADCRDFALDKEFSLAFMIGHGFQNLIGEEDQRHLFRSVGRHLKQDGLFVFETRNELASPLTESRSRQPYRRYCLPDGTEIQCEIEQDYDPVTSILAYRIWRRNEKTGAITEGSGNLKFSSDSDIRRELQHAGFLVENCLGDWDGRPAHMTAPERIYLCRKGGISRLTPGK